LWLDNDTSVILSSSFVSLSSNYPFSAKLIFCWLAALGVVLLVLLAGLLLFL
jgi:hypothetical protein